VDLKRQGRLDVHIPLFPPGDAEGRKALLLAMARKLKVDLKAEEVPALPDGVELGGNEMEGILVRALRLFETQAEDQPRRAFPDVVADVLSDMRASAHTERLELMDLLAVKECTDTRFLPERFRALPSAEVNRRIAALKLAVGE